MAEIVQSLFGMTPGMYQQAQQDRIDAQALQYARLDPFQQANYAIGRGASGLAGAVGGLLGGQDPELQRITARQQIAQQINPNDPNSIQQGIMALQQAGDTQGAMMLQSEYQKMQESRALTGQRQAAATASLAQAGRERVQAIPEKIQLAKEEALMAGAPGTPEYQTAYEKAFKRFTTSTESTTEQMRNAMALASLKGAPGSPEYNSEFETKLMQFTSKAEGKDATTTDITNARALAALAGPVGSPEYNAEFQSKLSQFTTKADAREPTTPELTNARAVALRSGPAGSPEYNAAFDAEYKRLTAEKAAQSPSVGTDRTAISLEVYNKPFDQLTTTERAVVNKRVEAEQAKRTPKIEVKNVMPGDQKLADIPAFRRSVQSTIEPQLKTITATDQALQAIDDSIASNNFISFNAARVQLAKALGDSQLSRQDIKQAGGDPSILGGLVDVVNTAFTSTPSPDTQKKIRDTLKAIQTVARRQANNEVDQQRKIALRSPGYNAEAVNEALNFSQLQGGAAPSAGGDLAAQAAAELARRKGGK